VPATAAPVAPTIPDIHNAVQPLDNASTKADAQIVKDLIVERLLIVIFFMKILLSFIVFLFNQPH
jgi:hypothetical protein